MAKIFDDIFDVYDDIMIYSLFSWGLLFGLNNSNLRTTLIFLKTSSLSPPINEVTFDLHLMQNGGVSDVA